MKVLVEDLPRWPWLDRLSLGQFAALIAVGSLATAAGVYGVTDYSRAAHYIDNAARSITEITAQISKERRSTATAPDGIRVTQTKSNRCHPSYSGCVPIVSDVDCAGGAGNGPAYSGRVQVIGSDEYGLDGDGDGIGCE